MGGWELILILATALTAFLIAQATGPFWRAKNEFWRATKDLVDDINTQGTGAGRSLGGIYGKPASEALTTDNQVAEFYNVPDSRRNGLLSKLRKLLSTAMQTLRNIMR